MDEIEREELQLSLRFYQNLLQNPGVRFTDMLAIIDQIRSINLSLDENQSALNQVGVDSLLAMALEEGVDGR